MARHDAVLAAKSSHPQIVFIGDSITHHLGGIPTPTGPFLSHRGDAFWSAITRNRSGLNLGFGADWTQHVLWRLDHGELDGLDPKHVVLMVGTNNVLWGNGDASQIVEGVRACLLRILTKAPQAQITLMGILPCRNPASHPNRLLAAKVNVGLATLAKGFNIDFLDLTSKFVDEHGDIPVALMDDGIHPTPAGYEIWRAALEPLLQASDTAMRAKSSVAVTPARAPQEGHPWWPGRFDEKCKLAATGDFDVMLVGDSITHAIESGVDEGLFKQMLAPAVIGNFGDAGDCTENVLWRFDHGELSASSHPKVVMVMIGTNNTRVRMDPPADIAAGVTAIVGRLVSRFPNARIVLLGILPCGGSPSDPKRLNNEKVNQILSKLNGSAKGRVHYLDIGGKFLNPDGTLPDTLMPDALHPNASGYRIWANAVVPDIRKLLEEPAN